MILASADSSGVIIIWDVITGVALHFLSEGNKSIQGIKIFSNVAHDSKFYLFIDICRCNVGSEF